MLDGEGSVVDAASDQVVVGGGCLKLGGGHLALHSHARDLEFGNLVHLVF